MLELSSTNRYSAEAYGRKMSRFLVLLVLSVIGAYAAVIDVGRIQERAGLRQSNGTPEFCNFAPDDGPCRARIPAFYFEPGSKTCSLFFYGGCEGNQNNFETEEECYGNCTSLARKS
uniref:Pancreatic trypsin inhibitor n=1 Tax=Rhipicephalus zambeziensis TaxID=60191 RepID=A0A224Y2D2_9ACAR